jgi:hypothetical protein
LLLREANKALLLLLLLLRWHLLQVLYMATCACAHAALLVHGSWHSADIACSICCCSSSTSGWSSPMQCWLLRLLLKPLRALRLNYLVIVKCFRRLEEQVEEAVLITGEVI